MSTKSPSSPAPALAPGVAALQAVVHGVAATSVVLLGLDALAAIGFSASLASAVSAMTRPESDLWPWLAAAVLAAASRGVVACLTSRRGARAAWQVKTRLRQRVVTAALAPRLKPMTMADAGGALMSLAVDEVEAVDAYVARFLPARRGAAVAPMLVLAAMAVASPICASILAATLLPFVLLMMWVGHASASQSRRQFAALSRLAGLFADRLRALPVVLAFGAQGRETARLAAAADDVAHRTLKILRVAFLSSGVLEFFSALSVALVAVFAGFDLLGLLPFPVPQRLDLGRAFFVLALAPEVFAPMRKLAAAYHDRQGATTAVDRVAAFERARVDDLATETADICLPDGAPSLRFDAVTIQYAGAAASAVTGLSFHLPAGKTLAILGPSGSGKTSVLRLLLGLAPLHGGHVFVGGHRLERLRGLASRCAWIGQVPLIVPGTLRKNLLLAAPDADDAALADAIERAGLRALLARRALGLNAVLDARGSGLSGGERRRIALARAFLKSSDLWLLDEPTSHLDAASEDALVATIARSGAGRTMVIATHSDKLAAIADIVVRL